VKKKYEVKNTGKEKSKLKNTIRKIKNRAKMDNTGYS